MSRVRYGALVADGWDGTWDQWGMWRFALGWTLLLGTLAIVPTLGLVAAIVWAVRESQFAFVWAGVAGFVVGMTLLVVAGTGFAGGLLAMANAALTGSHPKFADGWAGVRRSWARILGFYGILWAATFALIALLTAIIVSPIIVAAVSGSEEAVGAAVLGLTTGACCLYAVALVGAILFSLVSAPFAFTAIGAIAVDRAGVRGALAQGWWALRYHFKESLLVSLIMSAIAYAFSSVASMLIQPFVFIFIAPAVATIDTSRPDPGIFIGWLGLAMVLIVMLSVVTTVPAMVFQYLGWTSFYRQITGRETKGTIAAAEKRAAAAAAATPVPPGRSA